MQNEIGLALKIAVATLSNISNCGKNKTVTIHDCGMYYQEDVFESSKEADMAKNALVQIAPLLKVKI